MSADVSVTLHTFNHVNIQMIKMYLISLFMDLSDLSIVLLIFIM